MPMYTDSKTDGASVKADVELSPKDLLRVGAELHRYRLDDWWPPSGGGMFPGTFWNIRDGERDRARLFAEWETQVGAQWTTLLGVRYERVSMDAGEASGYNPAGGGNQARDANLFNASDRSRADNNWDLSASGALHRVDPIRHRVRLRAQGALAGSLRTLSLVDLADGRADEQLCRRRQRIRRQSRSGTGKGAHPVRHLRLACRRPCLGIQGHPLLHPRHRLRRRRAVERHDQRTAAPRG